MGQDSMFCEMFKPIVCNSRWAAGPVVTLKSAVEDVIPACSFRSARLNLAYGEMKRIRISVSILSTAAALLTVEECDAAPPPPPPPSDQRP